MDTSIFSQKQAFDYASQFERKVETAKGLQTAVTSNLEELSGMIAEVQRSITAGDGKYNNATLAEMQSKYSDVLASFRSAVK